MKTEGDAREAANQHHAKARDHHEYPRRRRFANEREDAEPAKRVLLALGIEPEIAQTAVRFSFDSTVTAAQLQEAAAAVRTAVAGVRSLGTPSTG